MKSTNPKDLVGGHSSNNLTRSEAEQLYRASLEDDQVFAELAQEDEIRELLEDEEFRDRFQARLRDLTRQDSQGWRRWMENFEYLSLRWYHSLALAAGIVAAALTFGGPRALMRLPLAPGVAGLEVVLSGNLAPQLDFATRTPSEQKWQDESKLTAVAVAEDAQIGLDRAGTEPAYRLGDPQRIGFRIGRASHVILIEERADGSAVRHYPNRLESSEKVDANALILIPPAGQGDLSVNGPVGIRTLRLFVFPTSVDPLADGADWNQLKQSARVRELRYQVQP